MNTFLTFIFRTGLVFGLATACWAGDGTHPAKTHSDSDTTFSAKIAAPDDQNSASVQKLHLTQEQMATVLGGGLKGFARYENGQIIQSRAMDNLLRILDQFPESLDVLPGAPRPQSVANAVAAPRKRKTASAGMVHEDSEKYQGKKQET